MNWKRNCLYSWEDWGHSWEEQGGRMGRNFSLECVCVCVTQDIFETSFYERRWTADQPPNPAEWRAFCTLSLRVCFCVIVQVIDARSNGNGANKMWHWSRRFVCVCSYVCVCMRVFLLMVQVPHEIRNVILDFGPTLGCFFLRALMNGWKKES